MRPSDVPSGILGRLHPDDMPGAPKSSAFLKVGAGHDDIDPVRPQGDPSLPDDSADANRRRRGRVRVKGQTCDLGEIVDVSATGIRIRLKAGTGLRVGDQVETTLHTNFACAKAILKIVWIRRAGLFSREAGAHFVDPDPEVRQALADMARSACDEYAPTLE